jgi:hypothetical protein
MKTLLLTSLLPALVFAQTPLQPRSAAAFNQNGTEIRLENPLEKLFEIADPEVLRIVPAKEIAGRAGAVIMDFEGEAGWPASVQDLKKSSEGGGWTALSGGLGLQPFQIEEALPPIKIGATTVRISAAVYESADAPARKLNESQSGVFLVKSSEGVMPSGSQGIVAGPRLATNTADGSPAGEGNKGLPAGFLVEFDPPVSAAGFAHFNGDIVVAVFGEKDRVLGRMRQGAKPDAVYSYGFEGGKGSIHALFIGNVFPEDGILDDLCFVP